MSAFQLIVVLVTIVSIVSHMRAIRRGGIHRFHASLWLLVWLIGALLVLRPNAASAIADALGIGRGVDAVLYTSVALLGYAVYRLWIALDQQEQTITALVSELALEEAGLRTDRRDCGAPDSLRNRTGRPSGPACSIADSDNLHGDDG